MLGLAGLISPAPDGLSMGVATYVVGVGRVRKHGAGRYELCLVRSFTTTNAIREAVREGRALHVEVLLPDGSSVLIPSRPRIDRGLVCVSLSTRLNRVWEGLWLDGRPVLVRVAVVGGEA